MFIHFNNKRIGKVCDIAMRGQVTVLVCIEPVAIIVLRQVFKELQRIFIDIQGGGLF